MRLSIGKIISMTFVAALLAGCGSDDPVLMNLKATGNGPDEFAIVPNKPLQAPDSFAALPPPTPGGANRSDQTPELDAIAALGGSPAAVARGPTASDVGLISYASRFGRDATIRSQLATEDLAFRKRKDGRLLERIFDVNVYYRAYEPQSLNQYRELERFRRIGVRTPQAPPEPRE